MSEAASLKQWESSNQIKDAIFAYDANAQKEMLDRKPWLSRHALLAQ
jgi:hypothetical protein